MCLVFFGAEEVRAGGLIGDLITGPAQPLPRAPITLCPSGVSSGDSCLNGITGSDGSFYIPDVPPGSYDVTTPGPGDKNLSGQLVVPNTVDDFGVVLQAK